MSNTHLLTKYFLKDQYKKELNPDNNLTKHKNELSRKYAIIVKFLWFGEENNFRPLNFKKALGNFNTNFENYQQHDAQEFIDILIDGIHEDLNRVIKKPVVE